MVSYADRFKDVGLFDAFKDITDFTLNSLNTLTVQKMQSLDVSGYALMRCSLVLPMHSAIERNIKIAGINRFESEDHNWEDIKDKQLLSLAPYILKRSNATPSFVSLVINSLSRNGLDSLGKIGDSDISSLSHLRWMSINSYNMIINSFDCLPDYFFEKFAVICGVNAAE